MKTIFQRTTMHSSCLGGQSSEELGSKLEGSDSGVISIDYSMRQSLEVQVLISFYVGNFITLTKGPKPRGVGGGGALLLFVRY
jgi:hypothetical protein